MKNMKNIRAINNNKRLISIDKKTLLFVVEDNENGLSFLCPISNLKLWRAIYQPVNKQCSHYFIYQFRNIIRICAFISYESRMLQKKKTTKNRVHEMKGCYILNFWRGIHPCSWTAGVVLYYIIIFLLRERLIKKMTYNLDGTCK